MILVKAGSDMILKVAPCAGQDGNYMIRVHGDDGSQHHIVVNWEQLEMLANDASDVLARFGFNDAGEGGGG